MPNVYQQIEDIQVRELAVATARLLHKLTHGGIRGNPYCDEVKLALEKLSAVCGKSGAKWDEVEPLAVLKALGYNY